jgi:AraC family transcriptional regulator of adaptative response/methylated-DNA-[protein]-cysteine methyltransferase
MITDIQKQEFYEALLDKNRHVFSSNMPCSQGSWGFYSNKNAQERLELWTQLNRGYECSSEFGDAFSKIIGKAPTTFSQHHKTLKASWIDTKLGPMIAIADESLLYLLEFVDRGGLEKKVERLKMNTKAAIIPGITGPIKSITLELSSYFDRTLTEFNTPLHLLGSPFQRLVWEELMSIPYATTRSYRAQATSIGKNKAYRAVANANGANQLAIIIPCHRIINSNGDLGGYGGGITRKKWLLEHEASYVK